MITQLKHARELKQMYLPLNTPVEERTFSPGYTHHWMALMKAHDDFMVALGEYADPSPRAGSLGQWRLVWRRFIALDKAARRCVDFIGKPGGDECELALLQFFLRERAAPFIGFWRDAIDAVEVGTPLTIQPGDMPRWYDGPGARTPTGAAS